MFMYIKQLIYREVVRQSTEIIHNRIPSPTCPNMITQSIGLFIAHSVLGETFHDFLYTMHKILIES